MIQATPSPITESARGERVPLMLALAVGTETGSRLTMLDPKEVLYVFLGSRLAMRRIGGPWDRGLSLKGNRVYARTREGVFLLPLVRAVREVADLVADPYFLPASQGILVNLRHCKEVDLRGRLMGVVVGYQSGRRMFDWITLSRRGLRLLLERLRPPRLARGTPSSSPASDR